jgi:pSer/pThr/pTyr-binding forkhead associated (FHA) protein
VEVLLFIFRVLIALTIYAFLGVILYYQRRDLRSISRMAEEAPLAQLIRMTGDDTAEVHLLRLVNLVGRAADNTISIDDKTLSAHHCRLSHHGGQWWLEDLGSRNGTMVNELIVEEPLVVTYGDLITMGRVEFRLEVGKTAPEHPGEESVVNASGQEMA